MDPRDFLDVANELANGASEADWRTAVSRGYYACFHMGRQLLEHCGFAVPQADRAHGYIWLRLSNCGHVDLQAAAWDLKELRSNRNTADYDLNQSLLQGTAFDQVLAACSIADLLDTVGAEPQILSQITAAIKTYEQTVLKENTWKE